METLLAASAPTACHCQSRRGFGSWGFCCKSVCAETVKNKHLEPRVAVLEAPSAVDQSELDSHIMLGTLGSVGLITDPSVRWRAEQLQPAPERAKVTRTVPSFGAGAPPAKPEDICRSTIQAAGAGSGREYNGVSEHGVTTSSQQVFAGRWCQPKNKNN